MCQVDAFSMPNKKKNNNNASPRSSSAGATAPLSQKTSAQERPPASSFLIHVTTSFLLKCLIGTAVLAFIVGRLSVAVILHHQLLPKYGSDDGVIKSRRLSATLPPIIVSSTKDIPSTIYSSKHFDTASVSTSDTLLVRRTETSVDEHQTAMQQKEVSMDGTLGNDSFHDYVGRKKEIKVKEESTHEPAGQHLLIDIKSVDGVFLNSEERLAHAIVDLINLSGLTMLSYHCHGLPPVGVSCVGVLLESHISFHTWPIQGVSKSLFKCCPCRPLGTIFPVVSIFWIFIQRFATISYT